MNTALAAKGGGGKGATVTRPLCGIDTGGGNFAIVEGHLVNTPSGNSNLQCHAKH